MNTFRYPTSTKLGAEPCGNKPNPPYPGAPDENCSRKGCTPHLRFKDGDNDLAMSRKILKQSNNLVFSNSNVHQTPINNTPTNDRNKGLTPFRALMNAGDPRNTNNAYVIGNANCVKEGCGLNTLYVNAINQVSSTKRASNAAAVRMGGSVPTNASKTESSLWTGNNKWVYDGSDYITFKKLQAKNRNFNDKTWGGDRHNSSVVALGRVRH